LVERRREVETEKEKNGEKVVRTSQKQRLGRRATRVDFGERRGVAKRHFADQKRQQRRHEMLELFIVHFLDFFDIYVFNQN